MAFHPLNSKERKEFIALLADLFGYTAPFDYTLFVNEQDKYYLATRDVEAFLDKGLRIERIGVYFGMLAHGELRLTIEGSQLLGPSATQCVVTITTAQRDEWMLGKDVMLSEPAQADLPQRFHIVQCGKDYLGCGKAKNGVLQNYVPKERYVGATFPDVVAD